MSGPRMRNCFFASIINVCRRDYQILNISSASIMYRVQGPTAACLLSRPRISGAASTSALLIELKRANGAERCYYFYILLIFEIVLFLPPFSSSSLLPVRAGWEMRRRRRQNLFSVAPERGNGAAMRKRGKASTCGPKMNSTVFGTRAPLS